MSLPNLDLLLLSLPVVPSSHVAGVSLPPPSPSVPPFPSLFFLLPSVSFSPSLPGLHDDAFLSTVLLHAPLVVEMDVVVIHARLVPFPPSHLPGVLFPPRVAGVVVVVLFFSFLFLLPIQNNII